MRQTDEGRGMMPYELTYHASKGRVVVTVCVGNRWAGVWCGADLDEARERGEQLAREIMADLRRAA